LGGTIWQDVAVEDVTDGIYNPAAEPGIANVSVNVIQDRDADGIWDPGEPILATFSGASGDYLLESLLPGDYLAQVSDTMATLRRFVVSSPGPNPGQDYNNQRQPYAVTLSAGGVNTTADFGYREYDAFAQADPPDPGVIGDLVWYDANGDGVYTPGDGDHPITGVTLALSRDGGADVTAATSGYGRYLFTDLPLGHTYTLRVTDAFGVLAGLIATTPAPNPGQDNQNQAQPYSVILGAQRQNYTADFGYTWPATTGDRVYFDLNRNGVEDAGEPGIPDVTLDLYRSGVKVASSATDATGMYTFTAPASLYTVTIAAAELAAGGTLYRWTPTSAATRPVTLTAGQVITATDFGLTILSSYTVTHRLNTSDPVRTNSPISFTVRITNTGNTWLTALAVTDLYSPTYLAYGVASRFAQPDSADHLDDGILTWPNVLTATAGAQSLASRQTPADAAGWLAPGASTTITLWFTTRADSFSFSPLGAANQIAVSAPRFDPDGAGPLAELPAGADLPAQAASSTVRILEPTGLIVTGFQAMAERGQAILTWQTTSEAQLVGFTVLRQSNDGALRPVNQELIPAIHAGASQGATYTFTDTPGPGVYVYGLEAIHADGQRTHAAPVIVRIGAPERSWPIFLPAVWR
jgi:hypothetical protein